MLQTEPRDGGFRATLTLNTNFSILPDHFPGQPILPGMCMVQAVLMATAMSQGVTDFRLRTLKNAKLMAPIQPGESMQIDASVAPTDDGFFAIKAKLTRAEQKVADISLIAGGGAS